MSSSNYADTGTGTGTVQKAARLVGIVFLLIGILGFVPGITSNFSHMTFMSNSSTAKLLGLFQVSILHNFVHLLYGVVGLVAARTFGGARKYLVVGGAVYLVLFVYGLVVSQKSAANFVPLNGADDILHLGLGIGMIGLGVALTRGATAGPARAQSV